ncbi:molybdopterin-containing oxidoreductase family protein [Pseudothauera rhizosphaerae]|uniref:Molybdopterin oxidoreductase family protein n=1 Tax=Pseudothauera rhizosphaerae TaxID=2565932 RepID=A0A4S4AJF4_9RHOO|nr:molybdopterin oxidoreductase family protein [Pseudothauera rhizosphaerae]THF59423.1 molybdopterin oxidoreductase family protein [Pseudothauera rhizosphaerae]
MAGEERRIVRAACPHDCPDTCAMEITVEGGRAVKVRGAADMPFTNGALCTKVAHYLERVYSDQRLLHPMKRVGRKGEGRFARITWDEALDTIAEKFRAIAADDPRAILPYSYAGTMGLVQSSGMDRRFFHRLGASLLDRTICSSAGGYGWKVTVGTTVGADPESAANARLILIWGANPVVSNLHGWRHLMEAKRRGARLVCIDPWRTQTAEKCDLHLAPLPSSDGALALAMMQVLVAENLLDHDYIARHTVGFSELRERVGAFTPEWAAPLTGLPADAIRQLARDYGTAGQDSLIRLNYGLNRHAGGGMAVRNIACLPALTGAWRKPGCGALLSTSGNFPVDAHTLERPDLYPDPVRFPPRTINMSTIGRDLLEAADPPIRAIYVYNSNPVAVAPDGNRVRDGFAREDLFCVVHELFQTDTADYADILLPATSQLEHHDVHTTYGHVYAVANRPAITPLGEAKPNSEVFRLLARRLGFADESLFDSDEAMAAAAFRGNDPRAHGLAPALAERGWARLNLPRPFAPFAEGGFRTPSGKCEFHSRRLADADLDPLPAWHPPRESAPTNPALAARYPLALITPPARHFLNTSFANLPRFLAGEGSPKLEIHPQDAAPRALADGDEVRIHNARGEFRATAVVTDRVRPGVVVSPSIWWRKLSPDGQNANAVTSDALTDLGGGACFYDCLVEVARP